VANWSFLTGHGRVLTAYGIVTDLTEAGHVVKHKDDRRNRYQIQARLSLSETGSQERAIGEILALLAGRR
jgi:hypothetical protein